MYISLARSCGRKSCEVEGVGVFQPLSNKPPFTGVGGGGGVEGASLALDDSRASCLMHWVWRGPCLGVGYLDIAA